MKKRNFYKNNVCNYYIENVYFINNGYLRCINVMKEFLKSNKIYFMFFRNDGINLSGDEVPKEILNKYVKDNGKIDTIYKNYNYFGYINNLDTTWDLIPDMAKYYLETTFCASSKKYEEFKDLYSKNQLERKEFFINNGVSDIMFSFVDSGDFCISFNTNKYAVDDIEDILTKYSLIKYSNDKY